MMNAPITSPINTRANSSSSTATTANSSMQHQSPANAAAPAPAAPAQGQTPSTDPFLKDFTLVAEAAKRAQVAVMVRDFEDCGLS